MGFNWFGKKTPKIDEVKAKDTQPTQSAKKGGPAGKLSVGAPSGLRAPKNDAVSPKSTKRGQSTSGKAGGQKAGTPKNVTAKSTKRGKN